MEGREQWPEAFREIERRIHHVFPQHQTRERAMRHITGLSSPIERKNSWRLAEAVGESDPYGVQYLLRKA